MNKTIFYIGLLLLFPAFLFAQERQQKFTLQQCLQEAVKHFPTQKQLSLNQNKHILQENNIKKNYLPQLNLNGQASYQSDVTKVPIPPIPNFEMPVISRNWYKINFDLDQIIWDGGITKSKQQLETVDYKISDQQVKIKTFALKKQVNIMYFNILFLQANLDALHVLIKDLNARIKDAETALKNGILLPSDVDVLKVNKKQAEQQIIEKQEDEKGLIASLNQFTRLNITSAKELATPKITLSDYTFINNRPEYQLLSLQKTKFSALEKMTATKHMPVFKLFGQAGYGRPGYDLLNDKFDTYYMVGVRLHWNIFDWNHVKQEKQILNIQSDIINTEQETFNESLRAELEKRRAGIQKFVRLINADKEILQLQQSVVSAANNKLKNGTITATNYLIELNKEVNVQLTMQAHKLQLLFAKYQYITAIGNL